eukprot:CAMPEP_0203699416 /NCGR_PEP_ID=MMETSP0091-20130426/26553_1 /ASSEMBLY_ACC=CAM_ASM_001089 /TAXON_ID=426623 /ORGANISM="Chaetoceros affinis, Strain CCMP159" /LENGTH=281 /DNA_ID=CAMNT_0050572231 /DNA_START=45 /DNA_END=890 /DNA_ORIENTATION=+
MYIRIMPLYKYLVLTFLCFHAVDGFGSASRAFFNVPKTTSEKPRLILISGSPGTGKSTFGMAVALDQGILKCISTDTIRAVMRSFVGEDVSPALHRSSYAPAYDGDDPVRSWKETCACLSKSVDNLVQDAIDRQVSLVVEGVHIVPSSNLIHKWEASGGVASGVLLKIEKEDKHKSQLQRRGFTTGNMMNENKKIQSYERIRAVQDEMMRLAKENDWLMIEQRTELDPLDLIAHSLNGEDIGVHVNGNGNINGDGNENDNKSRNNGAQISSLAQVEDNVMK